MATDYLTQRKAGEETLSGMVQGRDVDDELSRMSSNISTLRDRFLNRSGQLISSSGMTGKSDMASRIPQLDDKTKAVLARKKLDLQKGKIQAVYNNAYDMAVRRGMDTASATAFAQQMAGQEQEQAFTSSEAEKGREQKRKLNTLADQYGIANVNLNNEYNSKTDLGPLLLGAILGTGTNVAMNRYFDKTSNSNVNTGYKKGSSLSDYGNNELNERGIYG